MNNQQAFDTVLTHLRKQGTPSKTGTGDRDICAYRGEDGRSCAVGCMIPDSVYTPSLENIAIGDILKGSSCEVSLATIRAIQSIFEDVSEALLRDLQVAHDESLEDGLQGWENQMRIIAVKYKLNYTEPQ